MNPQRYVAASILAAIRTGGIDSDPVQQLCAAVRLAQQLLGGDHDTIWSNIEALADSCDIKTDPIIWTATEFKRLRKYAERILSVSRAPASLEVI